MDDAKRREIAGQIVESMLRSRSFAMQRFAEAQLAGDRKAARSWAASLRKVEKTLALYGLMSPREG